MAKIYKRLKYDFCSGDGDSGNNLFVLSTDSGGYTQLRTRTRIDYEAYSLMSTPYVTIRLRVTDERGTSFEKKIQLNIIDIQEDPEDVDVDVVLIGPGGGGGAEDDGKAGAGGTGAQFSFSFKMDKQREYAIGIGSGGKGGLNTSSVSYGSSGGLGGEFLNWAGLKGGRGGYAGPAGYSGGGGGGGSCTALLYLGRSGGMGRKKSKWRHIIVAGGGAGGTGRRERSAYPGKAADHIPFKQNNDLSGPMNGGGGFVFTAGDGPGGGGGGAGLKGGLGASDQDGAYGGSSGIESGVSWSNIFLDQELVRGRTGVTGSTARTPLGDRQEQGGAGPAWWEGISINANTGTGGYSGLDTSSRSYSNGGAGGALIRYKSQSMGGLPRLKLGGNYVLVGGYHVHVYDSPGMHQLSIDLYE